MNYRSPDDPGSSLTKKDKAQEESLLEVIKKAKAGDELAFHKLVDKYKAQVASIAYKMVGNYEDAKDISQIVFVKTYQNLYRFDTTKKLSTWLYRITINASIDFIRKHRKHRHETLDQMGTEIKEKKADVEKTYRRNLIKWAIRNAMDVLNAKQKSVFVLRDLQGLDIKEVAQITGMPQATVRWYLHRARSKLREELTKHYSEVIEGTDLKYGL